MIPRVKIVAININATYDEVERLFKQETYTRVPVYEESLDNVVGVINLKDFFLYSKDKSKFKIKDIKRETFSLYENKKVMDTLTEMQKTSNNLAIVLDEYGVTVGMITMEDILEEIVGDIKDEFDEEEKEEIKKINDREYIIEGTVKIDDINEKLGTDIESEMFDSIGGIIISSEGNVPEKGEEVDYGKYHLKVEEMDNNRIKKVRLFLPEEVEKSDS